MKALILAGGKGTRLRPLTVYTPKPVVPLLDRPFLVFQLQSLVAAGITDITLSLSYQPNKIEDVLGDGSDFGVRLKYVTEPSPLGTAGAYRFSFDGEMEPAVVLNGDILTDTPIAEIIDSHLAKKAAATIALTPVEDPSRYGLVETADDGRVLGFHEKPTAENLERLGTNLINAGIYVLGPEVLELITMSENRSFEYHIFPEILKKGLVFNSSSIAGSYWRDIGTPESYLSAQMDLLAERVSGFAPPEKKNYDAATTASIDERSYIGEGCSLKPGARIVNSVLGPGVHVDEKAVIEDSVLWAHTRVSAAADIRGAVVCRSCHIGRNAVVTAGTVLGDKANLPDYSRA